MNYIMELRKKNIGTELYIIMYIAIALSSFYYSSILPVFNPPVIIVAVMPQIVFFSIGVMKIFILDNHTSKEWIAVISGFIISVVMLISSGLEVGIMFFYVSVFAAKGIDFNKFLKIFLSIFIPIFLIAFISSLIGIIPDRLYGDRHSFGISYPTDFAAYVFYFFLAYSCLTKKHGIGYIAFAIILSIFVIKYPRARLDFGLIILTAVFFLIKEYYPTSFGNRGIRFVVVYSSIILCITALVLSLLYSESCSVLAKIDEMFSNRFSISHRAFLEFPINIFGSKITLIGNPQADPSAGIYPFFLDIYYIMSLFRYGIVGLIAVLSSMVISEMHAYETGDINMIIAFLLIAGTSFVDHHYLELSFNPFLPYVGIAMYSFMNNEQSFKQSKK